MYSCDLAVVVPRRKDLQLGTDRWTAGMSMEGGQTRWAIVGLVVGLVFLAISARGVDLDAVTAVLSRVETLPLVAALGATFAFMALKALRWAVILRPGIKSSFVLLHSTTYIGSAANLVIVHSGELLRSFIVGRRSKVSPSAILASVGVERVFDMCAVLTFIGVLLLFDLELADTLGTAALVAAALAAGGLTAMMIVARPSRLRGALSRLAGKLLPRALHAWLFGQIHHGLKGLTALGSVTTLLKTLALSIVQWSCIVAAVWLSVLALGQTVPAPAAIGVWVLMVLGLTLPSSPAQLGTTQLAYTLGLSMTDAAHEVAFAASVIYICTVNVPIMIIGAICWLRLGRVKALASETARG